MHPVPSLTDVEPDRPLVVYSVAGNVASGAPSAQSEIQDNGWLHCDADPELVFGDDVEEKYSRALRKIGIDPGMLSNAAGHA